MIITKWMLSLVSPAKVAPSDSCYIASAHSAQWEVINFKYLAIQSFTTPAHLNAYGSASFRLEQTGTGYVANCSATSAQYPGYFYGNRGYRCQSIGKGREEETTFSFDRERGRLVINQTWGSGDSGMRVRGVGEVQVDLACRDEMYRNPKWEMGEIYSEKTTACEGVDKMVNVTYACEG